MTKTTKPSGIEAFAGLEADDIAEAITFQYDTREAWLQGFVAAVRPIYATHDLTIPDKLRVSIGFAFAGGRSKVIGECWVPGASADEHSEIFIVPGLDNVERIAGVLTHELIHACVGHEAKHGPIFRRAALALGLEGKMTATTEGDAWHAWADDVIKALGPYPGSRLTGAIAGGKKKQTTRMIKASCPVCGFTTRMTRKYIDEAAGVFYCPMPVHMTCEEGQDDEELAETGCVHDGSRLTIEESEGEGE